ncbi:tigger transposable element-derived protein 1 [Trichonephila clavipes]|nr:tigger transposable element-derived protein 1 [Trichonephila clavipes]
MDFTEINSRGKRGELLGRIDRQNSRFRTAKTIIIKFGLHASFVELESAKNAVNEGPQQIFNCDETGLFWKRMPNRNYITKDEKSVPGYKPTKDRLTLLLRANSSSDMKLKPLLV